MLRSHHCGELRAEHVGQIVELCGWVDRKRDIGNLFFLSLRDRYGVTQCVLDGEGDGPEVGLALKDMGLEDCIKVKGLVRGRSQKDINSEMNTGAVEVEIKSVTLLNKCADLPFQVKDEAKMSDELRLKYRYLDLRRPRMQKNLGIRHQVIQCVRTALAEAGFLEIETPLMIRSTPEGARDFVVPSRTHQGKFYALPQSPQLYKQMLMISGCDRYFQFASAFRDEDLRADRVPVHTQIDMEMTFVDEVDVYRAVESYVTKVFHSIRGIDLKAPFRVMPYKEAIDRFGIDKPDLRFELELQTVTEAAHQTDFAVFKSAESVRMIVVEDGAQLSRKDIDAFTEIAKTYGAKGLAWTRVTDGGFSGGIGKFIADHFDAFGGSATLKDGALCLFGADTYGKASTALAHVRLAVGKRLDLIDESKFEFLWVNEFPMFEWDEDRKGYNAMHHLFTMPMAEDLEKLDTDPGGVRGQLYDLVLNGVELLSGSIRINQPEIQQKVLDIVEMPKEEAASKFGFLMEAFKYGAPPHGGSAMGLDRLVAILCGEDSIREVIAYPCNNTGVFPLDGAPAPINEVQQRELGLSIVKAEK